jgi:hypothetical protein
VRLVLGVEKYAEVEEVRNHFGAMKHLFGESFWRLGVMFKYCLVSSCRDESGVIVDSYRIQ